MVNYTLKVSFKDLKKKWNKLKKTGFFLTHTPTARIYDQTQITLYFQNKKQLDRAKRIMRRK